MYLPENLYTEKRRMSNRNVFVLCLGRCHNLLRSIWTRANAQWEFSGQHWPPPICMIKLRLINYGKLRYIMALFMNVVFLGRNWSLNFFHIVKYLPIFANWWSPTPNALSHCAMVNGWAGMRWGRCQYEHFHLYDLVFLVILGLETE